MAKRKPEGTESTEKIRDLTMTRAGERGFNHTRPKGSEAVACSSLTSRWSVPHKFALIIYCSPSRHFALRMQNGSVVCNKVAISLISSR